MANDILVGSGLDQVRFEQAPSVDLSRLPQEFQAQFGTTQEAEQLQREREARLAPERVQEERTQLREQLGRTLGQNVMGVAGEERMQSFEEGARQYLTEKEFKKAYEGELKRNIRVQQLRQDMAQQEMRRVHRENARQMKDFQRKFSAVRRTLANRMIDEQREMRQQIEDDYRNSMDRIQAGILRAQKRRRVGGILGGLAGAGLSFVLPGVGTAAAASMGLGSGMGGLVGAMTLGRAGQSLGRGIGGFSGTRQIGY
jgi:hypothetical protein